MALDLDYVEQMKNTELVKLARSLKISLVQRVVDRDWLIGEIWKELNQRGFGTGRPLPKLNAPAIEIQGMTKTFGKKVAVDNLDLVVNPGEIVGLVGPNGAGKTTTLRVLAGIIKATKGSVLVDGYDILEEPIPAKEAIGYIPEKPTCYPSLTVREYLMFMARIYSIPTPIALVRLNKFVEMFQLEEYLNTYIGTLSKGNLQRTLIVGIFIREPPYILAFDEPIYGLDPRGAWSLKAHLQHLKREGSAILVSTHILEVAQKLCDRFVIMNEGEVVGRGTLQELLAQNGIKGSLEEVFLSLTGGVPERW
ncbi:MAG: ABC transporter ATP-binding protein [Candidatus Thorarchaeota archaeon]|nr:ABC transporter ATP-binding protein [Candidatus Thorarchaeota archaeon]